MPYDNSELNPVERRRRHVKRPRSANLLLAGFNDLRDYTHAALRESAAELDFTLMVVQANSVKPNGRNSFRATQYYNARNIKCTSLGRPLKRAETGTQSAFA